MLELWGMRSTPSLLSLPGPLSPGVVAPDRVLPIYGLNRTKLHTYAKLNSVYLCLTELLEIELF